MHQNLIQLALFQLGLSLFLGVFILYSTYRILRRILGIENEMRNENLAYAIFVGAILFSVGSIVASVVDPLLNTFRLLSQTTRDTLPLLGEVSKYLLLFFGVSTTIAFVANLLGIFMFTRLTKVKELEEIRKNNLSVAIVTGVIVVVMTFFVRGGVVFLLEALVPYPEMPNVQ